MTKKAVESVWMDLLVRVMLIVVTVIVAGVVPAGKNVCVPLAGSAERFCVPGYGASR